MARARSRRGAIAVVALALVLAGGGLAAAAAGEAEPEAPPGSITFTAKNLFSTAEGRFERWRIARAEIDRADPGSGVVEIEVDVASLDTGIARRDDHLRSADFFDVARFPTARVRVSEVVRDGESERGHPRYRARFAVRIRDVERTLEAEFELVHETPPTVEGRLTLDRVEFGIGDPHAWWNPGSIEEQVPIRFTASFAAP